MLLAKSNYIAVDLGATSGRLIVSHNDELKEIHRFSNYLRDNNGRLTWDIDFIFNNIVIGLTKAFKQYKDIKSLSIDSWGVDYALLDNDKLIPPIYSYRDSRTIASSKEVHKIIPFEQLYKITGIQFSTLNTIYQLKDDLNTGRLAKASDFLHIPEYLAYLLTGKKVKEYTMASTTGLLDLKTSEFSQEIISKLNYPKTLFPKLAKPGTIIGQLKPEIAKQVGGNLNVVTCASHDTGSAFEAVDVDDDTVIISSGTWSLVGVKLPYGNNSQDSFKSNFTNEGGVGYIRYLKNIIGMWIFNETKKNTNYTFDQVTTLVEQSKYQGVFDVNDQSLLAPKDMKQAILKLLKDNPPKTDGDLYRSIFNSLAHSYKKTIQEIEHNLNKKYNKICIVGGGAKNKALNNIIKEVTHKEIIALPIEATSIGNIKVQKGVK